MTTPPRKLPRHSWHRSSASTSRGTKSRLLTFRRSSTPSISRWCLSGKLLNRYRRTRLFRSGNPFAQTMWCASNAERAGRCFAGTCGSHMVWKPTSIGRSGDFRRSTQSLLRDIPKHGPPSQSRSGWGGAQHRDGDGARQSERWKYQQENPGKPRIDYSPLLSRARSFASFSN